MQITIVSGIQSFDCRAIVTVTVTYNYEATVESTQTLVEMPSY